MHVVPQPVWHDNDVLAVARLLIQKKLEARIDELEKLNVHISVFPGTINRYYISRAEALERELEALKKGKDNEQR